MSSINDFGRFSPEGQFIPDESKSPEAVAAFLERNPALFSSHAAETTTLIESLSTKGIIVKDGGDYPLVRAQFQKLFPDIYSREVKLNDAMKEILDRESIHRDILSSLTQDEKKEICWRVLKDDKYKVSDAYDIMLLCNLEEADRVEFALKCLKKEGGPRLLTLSLQELKISNEEDRFKIYLECAKTPEGASEIGNSPNILEVSSEKERIKIIRECVKLPEAAKSLIFSMQLNRYKISNEEDRIEIIRECVKAPQAAQAVAMRIEKLEITKEEDRVNILMECAKVPEASYIVLKYINNSGISESGLLKIAIEYFKTIDEIEFSIDKILKFQFKEEENLVKLAQKLGETKWGAINIAQNVQKLNLATEENRIKIARGCSKTLEGAAAVIRGIDNFEIARKEDVIKLALEIVKDMARQFEIDLKDTLKAIESVPNNPELQMEILSLLVLTFLKYSEYSNESKKWIKKHSFIDKIFSIRNISLINNMLFNFNNLIEDERLYSDFESILSNTVSEIKSGRGKTIRVSEEFYLKNMLLVLLHPDIDKAQLKKYADRSNISGFKKDALKMQRLLETLILIVEHKPLIGEALPSVLDRLFPEKATAKEVVSYGIALQGVLQLDGDSLLKDKKTGFEDLLIPALLRVVPLGVIDEFKAKFDNFRVNFRGFTSISTYAGKLNTLWDSNDLMKHYARFIKAVLEGKFLEVRQSVANNAHLSHLEQQSPEVLRSWHAYSDDEKDVELKLGTVADSGRTPQKISYRDQLIEKFIHHQHLPLEKIPELIAYLKGSGSAEAIKDAPTAAPPYDQIQQLCLELIEGKEEKETLLKLKQSLVLLGSEADNFKNDIEGFLSLANQRKSPYLESPYKGLKLSITNNPNDYFLCGTEVNGSCQSVTAGAGLNKCLLSYLLDGKNRLVVIKDPGGKIVARSVIRLLWDETAKVPVLFQEQSYGSRSDPKLDEMLYNEAKEMAENLHISYASFQERPKNPLRSLGGPVPYEYSDAADRPQFTNGVYSKGLYTISG